jgi:hypothetical protein
MLWVEACVSTMDTTEFVPQYLFGGFLDEIDSEDSDIFNNSFNIPLQRTGEGGYHTKNDPKDPYQRETVTERRGPVDIKCNAREVIHGDFAPDTNEFATLLVYDFHFNAMKRFRRIASASITIMFSSSIAGTSAPVVQSMAPFGLYSLLPTMQDEKFTREGNIQGQAGYAGVSLGTSYKWSNEISRTTNDDTSLVGATVCDRYGKVVGVNWVLHENETTNTGVPSFMRGAILLKRKHDEMFECTFKINVEADWKTEISRFLGSKGIDDPILFDPSLPPTNRLRKDYDLENMGSLKVADFFDVTFKTTFGNSIKAHHNAG